MSGGDERSGDGRLAERLQGIGELPLEQRAEEFAAIHEELSRALNGGEPAGGAR